jgi:Zn ribbon nucleic-acid-binding protein
VCPRCAQQDKIVVDTATDARHCVHCGFTDSRPTAPDGGAAVDLPTRVSRPAARRVETPAEAVRLVDPAQDK